MKLIDRITAAETRAGKFLMKWVSGFFLICATLGGSNEYLSVLPTDFVPQWVKTMVVICGVISFVAGKLTAKKAVQSSSDKPQATNAKIHSSGDM